MVSRRAKTRWTIGLLLVVLLIVVSAWLLWPRRALFRTYISTSGHYRLVVYKNVSPLPLAIGPGDADGGSGSVELYDAQGRLKARARVSTVSSLGSPGDLMWRDHSVSLPGEFRFDLPDGP